MEAMSKTTGERLPSNLLQAQRDYFGAHTYERTDRPRGEFFHTNWTGGDSSASTYNVQASARLSRQFNVSLTLFG